MAAALILMMGSLFGGAPGPAPSGQASASALPEAPAVPRPAPAAPADDGKLRIIAFGAHPDDCELKAAGVAAKWAALGHHVKFVSLTNGDIGHWGLAGGPLALRRLAEVQKCAAILGIQTHVVDIHDGELLPTLENRRIVTRLIREWKADIVLSHRPNDYHPDHRNVGLLVQDAAFMVTVPYFCPDSPYLQNNPVFLFYEDRFTKPNRFSADIVVGIDDVIDKKLAAVEALESQFYEGGCNGGPHLVPDPKNAAAVAARRKAVRQAFDQRFASTAKRFGLELAQWYGAETAAKIKYAEAFEVCEYGRSPSKEEIRKLFPFFPPAAKPGDPEPQDTLSPPGDAAGPANIIFVLTDDHRADALGFCGDRRLQTPHLDRLAREGVYFSNAFVTTSICAVSRATFFTGQYARRHGIHDFATPLSPEQWAQTYPALLRQAGYRTGFIGKFGVGKDVAPMAKFFDYWKGLPGQAGPFFDPKDPTKTHATARFGDQALEFLKECRPGKPFCLSISFSAPHARDGQPREFLPDLRDEKLYADISFPPSRLTADQYFQALPKFVQESEGRKRWQRRFADAEMFQNIVRDYHRLIHGVDREVGRILETLRERQLADNTIIVFTADNGFFLGERGMADKWLPYEDSIRVPFIVYDPRLPAGQRGRRLEAMVLNIDLAPTLLDYAGLTAPERMQGRSVRPLVEGKNPTWRTEWFYEHLTLPQRIPPTEGVRTERWKYFRWMGADPVMEELYDLKADPLEEHNLAGKPEHAKTLAELRARWEQLRNELR